MKKQLQLSGLMMFIILTFTTTLLKAQPITVDGNFTDWDDIPFAHTNALGSGTLTATKTFATTDDVFFYIEGTNALALERFDIYFDTDNNSNTGFISNGYPVSSGADILCQGNLFGGTIYSGGAGYNWNSTEFTFANAMSFSSIVTLTDKKAIEFSIKKTAIGVTTGIMNFAFVDSDDNYAELGTMPQINLPTSKFIQVPLEGTLPVSLTAFEAKAHMEGVKLSWSTLSEKNNSHFDIYRSIDGVNFEKIGFQNGNNNSSTLIAYSYVDKFSPSGVLYYQLEQVDFDGKKERSLIISLNSLGKETSFYLRKINNQELVELTVYAEKNASAQFLLSDISGKVLLNKTINLVAGQQTINLTAKVSSGLNIATLQTKIKSISQKILID